MYLHGIVQHYKKIYPAIIGQDGVKINHPNGDTYVGPGHKIVRPLIQGMDDGMFDYMIWQIDATGISTGNDRQYMSK